MGGRGGKSDTAKNTPSEEMQYLANCWTEGSGHFRSKCRPGMEIDTQSDVGKYNEWSKDGSYGGTLYRGVGLSNFDFNKLEPGFEFKQDGISSWSSEISVGAEFALMSRNDKKVLSEVSLFRDKHFGYEARLPLAHLSTIRYLDNRITCIL